MNLSMYMWKTAIGSIFASVHSPDSSCVTVITNGRLILSVERGLGLETAKFETCQVRTFYGKSGKFYICPLMFPLYSMGRIGLGLLA